MRKQENNKKDILTALNTLRSLFSKTKQDLQISSKELYNLIQEEYTIPISIFESNLAPLETLVKYLKENLNLTYSEIAKLLNRNERTVWTSYKFSIKKEKERLIVKPGFFVPISIFSDRKFSILESLVQYLKEKFMLSYHEIAVLLNRDDRTIWTVYRRAKEKYVK
jgi:hypothetical protein